MNNQIKYHSLLRQESLRAAYTLRKIKGPWCIVVDSLRAIHIFRFKQNPRFERAPYWFEERYYEERNYEKFKNRYLTKIRSAFYHFVAAELPALDEQSREDVSEGIALCRNEFETTMLNFVEMISGFTLWEANENAFEINAIHRQILWSHLSKMMAMIVIDNEDKTESAGWLDNKLYDFFKSIEARENREWKLFVVADISMRAAEMTKKVNEFTVMSVSEVARALEEERCAIYGPVVKSMQVKNAVSGGRKLNYYFTTSGVLAQSNGYQDRFNRQMVVAEDFWRGMYNVEQTYYFKNDTMGGGERLDLEMHFCSPQLKADLGFEKSWRIPNDGECIEDLNYIQINQTNFHINHFQIGFDKVLMNQEDLDCPYIKYQLRPRQLFGGKTCKKRDPWMTEMRLHGSEWRAVQLVLFVD